MNTEKMYKNSQLLYYLKNKYNLKEKMKLSIEFINYISEKENIEVTDLMCIFQIDSRTMWSLRNSNCKYTRLRFNKYDEIKDKKLIQKEIINYNEFIKLKEKMNIKEYTLIRKLGISRYKYYKLIKDEISKVRIKNTKVKHIVDLIKIDIKYIETYKDRYYTEYELEQICKSRKITLDSFLKYFNNNYRHYKFNKMVIEKNDNGFWIGEETKIPNEFINANYNQLIGGLNRVANNVTLITGCKSLKSDCIQEALMNLYEKCGNIIKNFSFDMSVLFNILMSKAKYIMLSFCKKNFNNFKEIDFKKY